MRITLTRLAIVTLLCIGAVGGCKKPAPKNTIIRGNDPERGAILTLIGRRKIAEAMVRLKAYLKRKPRDTGALNAMGHCYEVEGKLDQALRYYRRAHQLYPVRVVFSVNIARVCYRIGNVECSLEQVAKLLPNDHTNASKLLYLVSSPKVSFIVPTNHKGVNGLNHEAIAAVQRLDLKSARALLAAALGRAPTDLASLANLGQVHTLRTSWKDAKLLLRGVQQYVETGKIPLPSALTRAELAVAEGIALQRGGELTPALAAYRAALKLAPKSARALFGLGATHFLLRDDEAAQQTVARLRSVSPRLASRLDTMIRWGKRGLKGYRHAGHKH